MRPRTSELIAEATLAILRGDGVRAHRDRPLAPDAGGDAARGRARRRRESDPHRDAVDTSRALPHRSQIWYRTCVSSPEETAKRCSRCGLTRPISEFNASVAFRHQFYCRDCQKAWYREHRPQYVANVIVNTDRYRERNQRFVVEYLKEHPCVDCGETDPLVLEFDHVRGKERNVSQLKWSSAPTWRIMGEIERCDVRCVNCHMRRTATQSGWRKGSEVL